MIGILGGTFDPIHEGHIKIAKAALTHLSLSRVELIPSYQPPHREKPIASPEDRFAMAKLAITSEPLFHVNDIEIKRKGISYSIDTLIALRKQIPHEPLCLLLGTDVFAHFTTWHEWKKIPFYAHLIIVGRSNSIPPAHPELQALLEKSTTTALSDLQKYPAGKIFYLNNALIPISATLIRASLQLGEKNISDLNSAVEHYIREKGIYQNE
jgi:nicotinate-nucleotide adenylyltransferase